MDDHSLGFTARDMPLTRDNPSPIFAEFLKMISLSASLPSQRRNGALGDICKPGTRGVSQCRPEAKPKHLALPINRTRFFTPFIRMTAVALSRFRHSLTGEGGFSNPPRSADRSVRPPLYIVEGRRGLPPDPPKEGSATNFQGSGAEDAEKGVVQRVRR